MKINGLGNHKQQRKVSQKNENQKFQDSEKASSKFAKYDSNTIQKEINGLNFKTDDLGFDPNVFYGKISFASEKIKKEKSKIEIQLQELADKLNDTPKGETYDALINKISLLNRKIQGLPEKVEKVNNGFNNNFGNPVESDITNTNESTDASIWDKIKNKISMTIPAVQQFRQSLKGVDSKNLELVKYKISEIEEKLEKVKNGEIHLNTKEILETETQLEKLNRQKEKIENGNISKKTSDFSSNIGNISPKMNEVSVKIKNHIKQWSGGISNGLGQILRYAGALFSLRGIYSILSSSAQSWLSSQNAGAKQLSANIEYMKYAMGSALAPIIQFVTNLVYQLMKAIQSVAYALTGVNIFAKASANSYSNMAKSAGQAKNATKQLAGVHNEINNVQTNNSGGSGGASAPSFDLSGLDNTPNSIIDAIKSGDWYEIGATIGQKLNEAMSNIPWDQIQDGARKIGTNIAQFLNGFIATTDWNQVGNTLAQGINTAIYFAYNFVTTFDWKKFGQAIGNEINGFFNNIDWGTSAKTLSNGIEGILSTIYTALETIDWQQLAKNVEQFVVNIDWNGLVQGLFEGIGAALAGLAAFLGTLIVDAFTNIGGYFSEKTEECGGNIISGIFKGITDAIVGIGSWINDNIFRPFIDGFKNIFGIHSPSTVMAEMGGYIVEGLKNGLSDLWQKIKSPFEDFGNNVSSKFNEIKGKVIDWANNTKTTVSNWGNNIKTKVSECWTNASNTVRDKVNTLKTNISTGLNTTKSTISSWGDNIKNTFTNLGKNAATWGKDLVDNMASGIRNNVSKVTNAVSSVAGKIKSFLHFTEPDEGPLSDFHTYMPDMIDLMVQGIKSNTNKIKSEIEDLAGMMSYTINTDAIVDIPKINSNVNTQEIKTKNSSYDSILSALSDMNFSSNSDRPIYLTIKVGDRVLSEILLNDLRNKKRQTGKDIEAIIGD